MDSSLGDYNGGWTANIGALVASSMSWRVRVVNAHRQTILLSVCLLVLGAATGLLCIHTEINT